MLVICNLAWWLLAPLMHQKFAPMPFAHISATAWIASAISGVALKYGGATAPGWTAAALCAANFLLEFRILKWGKAFCHPGR